MKNIISRYLDLILMIPILMYAVMSASCNAPVIPEPIITSIIIEAPDTCKIVLDGIEFGYGSMELIVLENYPNYLQIGSWKFVLLPPVNYAKLKVE